MSIRLETKIQIFAPIGKAYEAFVNPELIGNFWFSGSSCRWETGSRPFLTYAEYGVGGFDVRILNAQKDEAIVFKWGEGEEETTVIINFMRKGDSETIVEVIESGWNENDAFLVEKLTGNKEGWTFMLVCLKAYLEHGINTLRTGLLKE